MANNNTTRSRANSSNTEAGQAHQTRHYDGIKVTSIQENGVTNSIVVNVDSPIIARDKTFATDEEHTYLHIGVNMLLSALTGKIGRYLKYKVVNVPHKFVGVTSLLCLLYEDAELSFDREWVAKGTVINGVPAKGDLWHTTNLVVKFKQLSNEDSELAQMLLADVKPKTTQEIKPLF